MTTDNIKSTQIMLTTKDGEVLVGTTSDPILLRMIASYVKFVKADKSLITELPLNELIEKDKEI